MPEKLEPRRTSLSDLKLKTAVLRSRPVGPHEERRNIRARAALLGRIECEFQEMPGLSLTLGQASRLFGLPPDACARVLDYLVEHGPLRVRSDGRYSLRTQAA